MTNSFDGIINNTPTVDELEAKVKAGEQISLLTLRKRLRQTKNAAKRSPLSGRSSKRIRNGRERRNPRKQKSQDLERS